MEKVSSHIRINSSSPITLSKKLSRRRVLASLKVNIFHMSHSSSPVAVLAPCPHILRYLTETTVRTVATATTVTIVTPTTTVTTVTTSDNSENSDDSDNSYNSDNKGYKDQNTTFQITPSLCF